MSKRYEEPKPDIIMNLRFELDVDTYTDFWHIGRKVLKLRTKNEILKKLIKIAKELQ